MWWAKIVIFGILVNRFNFLRVFEVPFTHNVVCASFWRNLQKYLWRHTAWCSCVSNYFSSALKSLKIDKFYDKWQVKDTISDLIN